MAPEEFEQRFVETIVRAALPMFAGYGFPEGLDQAQGRLYHGTFLKYFSFFAWKFPSWLFAVASRCPFQDVRRTIIEDGVDEEVSDPDADGRCHIDVLYDEADACGISRAEIAAAEPTPVLFACIQALENLANSYDWQTSFAALAGLEIGSSEPAVKVRQRLLSEALTPEQIQHAKSSRDSFSLSDRTGVDPEQLMFAALHEYKDQFHGGGELALIVKYSTSRAVQESMLWAAKAGVEMFVLMREEIDQLARAAVGLAPGERMLVGSAT